jgi:hypothetical protein
VTKKKKVKEKEKLGRGRVWGGGVYIKLGIVSMSAMASFCCMESTPRLIEVFHETVTLPAEDKFDLGSSKP